MIQELADALNPREYNELPEAIRALYTPKEWMWLSSNEKARLVQTETEPEIYND